MNRFAFLLIVFCICLANHRSAVEATPGVFGIATKEDFHGIYRTDFQPAFKMFLWNFGRVLSRWTAPGDARHLEMLQVLVLWQGVPDSNQPIPDSDKVALKLGVTEINRDLNSQIAYVTTLLELVDTGMDAVQCTDKQRNHRAYVVGVLDGLRTYFDAPHTPEGVALHATYSALASLPAGTTGGLSFSKFQQAYRERKPAFKLYAINMGKAYGLLNISRELAVDVEFLNLQETPSDFSPIMVIGDDARSVIKNLDQLMNYLVDEKPQNEAQKQEFLTLKGIAEGLKALPSASTN